MAQHPDGAVVVSLRSARSVKLPPAAVEVEALAPASTAVSGHIKPLQVTSEHQSSTPRPSSNHVPQGFTSAYRGVSKHRHTGRYEVHIWDASAPRTNMGGPTTATGKPRRLHGRQIYVGAFSTEEDAARAFDRAAIVYLGKNTKTNFPLSSYKAELPRLTSMTREDILGELRRGSDAFTRSAAKFRGVTRHTTRADQWEARIASRPPKCLGTYPSPVLAAVAYDHAILTARPNSPATNFPAHLYRNPDTNAMLPLSQLLQRPISSWPTPPAQQPRPATATAAASTARAAKGTKMRSRSAISSDSGSLAQEDSESEEGDNGNNTDTDHNNDMMDHDSAPAPPLTSSRKRARSVAVLGPAVGYPPSKRLRVVAVDCPSGVVMGPIVGPPPLPPSLQPATFHLPQLPATLPPGSLQLNVAGGYFSLQQVHLVGPQQPYAVPSFSPAHAQWAEPMMPYGMPPQLVTSYVEPSAPLPHPHGTNSVQTQRGTTDTELLQLAQALAASCDLSECDSELAASHERRLAAEEKGDSEPVQAPSSPRPSSPPPLLWERPHHAEHGLLGELSFGHPGARGALLMSL